MWRVQIPRISPKRSETIVIKKREPKYQMPMIVIILFFSANSLETSKMLRENNYKVLVQAIFEGINDPFKPIRAFN